MQTMHDPECSPLLKYPAILQWSFWEVSYIFEDRQKLPSQIKWELDLSSNTTSTKFFWSKSKSPPLPPPKKHTYGITFPSRYYFMCCAVKTMFVSKPTEISYQSFLPRAGCGAGSDDLTRSLPAQNFPLSTLPLGKPPVGQVQVGIVRFFLNCLSRGAETPSVMDREFGFLDTGEFWEPGRNTAHCAVVLPLRPHLHCSWPYKPLRNHTWMHFQHQFQTYSARNTKRRPHNLWIHGQTAHLSALCIFSDLNTFINLADNCKIL